MDAATRRTPPTRFPGRRLARPGLALAVAIGLLATPAFWPGHGREAFAHLGQGDAGPLDRPPGGDGGGPPRPGRGELDPPAAEVLDLVGRWHVEEARRRLEPLVKARPGDARLKGVAARVAFYRGDYAEAARLARGSAAQPVLDWFTTTRDLVTPMAAVEGRHFVVRHAPADAILAKPALDALEAAYGVLSAEWGLAAPEAKIRVEIFPDARSFYPATGLSRRDIEASGAVGLCVFNKVMLLSPRALVQGYRWLDAVVHEFVHYAVVRLSENAAPIWIHEGIAKYYESRWRAPESRYLQPIQRTLLAEAVASGRFVGFAEMEPSLVKLPGPREVQLAYAEGASAVEFLEHEAGPDALRRLLAAMASGPREAAGTHGIEAVTGGPFAEFERRWRTFVAGKHLVPVEGIELPAYRVKEGPQAETAVADEATEVRLLRDAAQRTHVRLGDRLRERGRLAPAILEYQRAVEKGPPSATLLTRLGRALVEGGRRKEGREQLARATELYPDYPSAYVALGRLEMAEARPAAAAAAFGEALQINPFDPVPHAGLAVALRALGKTAEAGAARDAARALGGRLE